MNKKVKRNHDNGCERVKSCGPSSNLKSFWLSTCDLNSTIKIVSYLRVSNWHLKQTITLLLLYTIIENVFHFEK